MGKMKRLVSIFLALVMTLAMVPSMMVSAADAEQPIETEQTEADGTEIPQQPETDGSGESEVLPQEQEESTENVQAEEPAVWSSGTGDFVVTGGTAGTDYAFADGVLTIRTGTQLTIRNRDPRTPTGHRIVVPAHVRAELVFDGVNIRTSENSPFTLTPKVGGGAQARIILADNSENILYCNSSSRLYAGLRAGETTKIIIDDSIANRDNTGRDITPVGGKIPYDLTLENGTVLHEGDSLSNLDSPNRGTLTATGAYFGAGIGGASGEHGGTIIINGGIINASNNYPSDGYGAGIGGGTGGDGGNITINGGLITARGPYHAAGIGGGCHVPHSGNALEPAAANPTMVDNVAGYSGNITINGGLSYSYGSSHGEAFGDGCVWYDHREYNYKIIVTGGTLLPYYSGSRGDLGSRAGDVYVTGGSLKVARFGQSGMTQKVYGDMNKRTEVFQTTVSLEYLGLNKVGTVSVENFEFLIGGKKTAYGAPTYTDDKGILYLWLPSDTQGKEVTVNTTVKDKQTGETITPESFFITNVAPNSKLKQYAVCVIPNDVVPTELMTKHYDGLAFGEEVTNKFLENLMKQGGIPVENPAGGKLTDRRQMKIEARRLTDDGSEPDTNYEGGTLAGQRDAGKYELVITSTQYANTAPFSDAYWGHRGYYKYAEITKADTESIVTANKTEDVKLSDEVTYEAEVRPAREEGAACAAPRGSVQFYVNGKMYGDPVALTEHNDAQKDGHYYSTASFRFKLLDVEGLQLDSKEIQVAVEYLGEDINYNHGSRGEVAFALDMTDIDLDGDGQPDINIDVDDDGVPDLNVDTDGDLKPDLNIDTNKDLTPDVNIDTDNTGEWKPSGEGGNADGIWKPDTAIDTNGDGTGDKDHHREPVDTDKDGVDDNWKPDVDVDSGEVPYETADPSINIDTDGDGTPDINIDTNDDRQPDVNIDTDGDLTPDINIDTNDDKQPDINIDTNGDGTPDINIDTDGDKQPDVNIDTDGDKQPDINIDTDGDGDPDIDIDTNGDNQPDINIDTDGDGDPDLNIDTNDDKQPDINIDTDGDKQPDINIDTDGDGDPDLNIDTNGDGDPDVNIDTDGDGDPDLNIDTNDDKQPDINIDTNDDKQPDINIDTNDDKQPDINIDTNDDKQPDINIDTDDDKQPDINIDTDGDKQPDINIDTNDDRQPDVNIDTDGDGKPDLNIDTDKDGRPDVNVDTDKDLTPDVNIDTDNTGEWKPSGEGGNADKIWKPDTAIDTNGGGKGDKDHHREPVDTDKDGVDDNWKPSKDVTSGEVEYDTADPSINIDTDGDGTPDINIDKDGDGKPDVNIDTDGDLKPDVNVDVDEDGKPDLNIDTDKDGKPDLNVDLNGDQIPDLNIDTDNTGKWKPSGEGGNADKIWKPDTGIDTNGDGKGDKDHNRVTVDADKDGVDDNWKPNQDVTVGDVTYDTGDPSINIDTDGDGKPDVNVDVDGDGKPDVNIDTDGDLKPDKNIDRDGDGRPDLPVVPWKPKDPKEPKDNGMLNREDHFAYIIGYPVDYVTGMPTTDQTRMPIRPQGKITRAEVATIYFRMLNDETRNLYWTQQNSYSDVSGGDWFNTAISTMSNAGIINGYPDGTFRPNAYITRAEFAAIAVRFFEVEYQGADMFPDIQGHWAGSYINKAASAKLINGYPDGTFGPNRQITRAEAVALVNRTLNRHPDRDHLLDSMLRWPDNMDTNQWYYADMQEATNSHTYKQTDGSEVWTGLRESRNWKELETAWANSSSGSRGAVKKGA